MKLLFFLALTLTVVFLAWATIGWGSPDTRTWHQQLQTKCAWVLEEPSATRMLDGCGNLPQIDAEGQIKDTYCLLRMEAAMRAMDPYVDPPVGGSIQTFQDILYGHQLWMAVKKECWRQS